MNGLLVGDQCIDEYQYGTVDRISPEAPVPVFTPTKKVVKKGMAANVEKNLLTLDANVTSIFGDLSIKTRMIDERHQHQLMRIDNDKISNPYIIDRDELPDTCDAVVISDYNKGFITNEVVLELKKLYDCPFFVDTKKKDLKSFEGCYVKINNYEYQQLENECDNLIVTRGGDSVFFNNKEYPVRNTNVFDVTGAGDTFLSSLCFRFVRTQDIDDSIRFAIAASSITVQHFGVYAPTLKEIHDEIRRPD